MAFDPEVEGENRAPTRESELEMALRPFALMIMQIGKDVSDDEIVTMSLKPPPNSSTDPWQSTVYTPPFPVLVGDVRRAAQILNLQRKLEGRIDSERVRASQPPKT